MRPFDVDPNWFERCWYGSRPRRDDRPLTPIGRRVWLITAALVAWFVAGSSIAAVLAVQFGWLGPGGLR